MVVVVVLVVGLRMVFKHLHIPIQVIAMASMLSAVLAIISGDTSNKGVVVSKSNCRQQTE